MKRKILVIFVVCLGLLALIPNQTEYVKAESSNLIAQFNNDDCEDVYLKATKDYPWINDTNWDGVYLNIGNTMSEQETYNSLIWFPNSYLANDTTFEIVYLELYVDALTLTDINSMNVSLYELYSNFNETEATWNNRTNGTYNGLWEIPGGFYNPTPIESKEISTTGWHQWNITEIFRDWVNNLTQNVGLLFRCTDSYSNTRWLGYGSSEYATASQRPKLNITYSGGNNNPTGISNIFKDIWNLKGFSGEHKLASAIYSEITNCTALSWKNATTGYWYTYWPSLGLTEDAYLEFGDGLFILTDQDTTWDHT